MVFFFKYTFNWKSFCVLTKPSWEIELKEKICKTIVYKKNKTLKFNKFVENQHLKTGLVVGIQRL